MRSSSKATRPWYRQNYHYHHHHHHHLRRLQNWRHSLRVKTSSTYLKYPADESHVKSTWREKRSAARDAGWKEAISRGRSSIPKITRRTGPLYCPRYRSIDDDIVLSRFVRYRRFARMRLFLPFLASQPRRINAGGGYDEGALPRGLLPPPRDAPWRFAESSEPVYCSRHATEFASCLAGWPAKFSIDFVKEGITGFDIEDAPFNGIARPRPLPRSRRGHRRGTTARLASSSRRYLYRWITLSTGKGTNKWHRHSQFHTATDQWDTSCWY